MPPATPLPLADEWNGDPDVFVNSLLTFATSSTLFRNLCGGVHILDFLTREPDLYTTLLSQEWRGFFDGHSIHDILDLFMREDIQPFLSSAGDTSSWRDGPAPPRSLTQYIHEIRRHSLKREFVPHRAKNGNVNTRTIPTHVAVGMKPKKCHEVEHFSRYVEDLTADVGAARGQPVSHIVDFGSGQNYLGRTLASPPYDKHIIAIERRHHNISGARGMDVHAKLAKKKIVLRNKKEHRGLVNEGSEKEQGDAETVIQVVSDDTAPKDGSAETNGTSHSIGEHGQREDYRGSMDYIEHDIKDGYLEPIISHVVPPRSDTSEGESVSNGKVVPSPASAPATDPQVMVISLHSCGNLLHHGVRSLVLNPSVVAVAMIGCCYNLMTERLGPATYKLPILRPQHPRLVSTSNAYDPHGFPMSETLETFEHESGPGVRLNITARMMAVQAPYNWGEADSEAFFTRHFYRALLQRIFLDRDVVPKPTAMEFLEDGTPSASSAPGTPLIVGSLRKAAFDSFPAYVRAAVEKLRKDEKYGASVAEKVGDISNAEIEKYMTDYWHAKKNLSIVWSLMAFSASVVEAIVVTDRWLFLREHDVVKECWVEPVFDYAQSPRNLAVIGVKK